MTTISEPPSSVPQGQSFDATYTVTEHGGGIRGRVPGQVLPGGRPSARPRIDLKTADPEAVGALGPGATFTHTLTLTVRPETVPGTYRMQGVRRCHPVDPKTVIEKRRERQLQDLGRDGAGDAGSPISS